MINRKNWLKLFQPDSLPLWLCPKCQQSALKIEQDSFKYKLTAGSKEHRSHDSWHPEDDLYRYNVFLTCSNKSCDEKVVSVGNGFVDFDYYYDQSGETRTSLEVYFRPKYFNPSIDIFPLPEKAPNSLVTAIRKSFELFYADQEASLNQLRSSVEVLLNEIGIDRVDKNGNSLKLHSRLDKLKGDYAKYMEPLKAIKWLGNAGSHSTDTTKVKIEDVLDGYEIFQPILNELFSSKGQSIKELVSAINEKKGPVTK